MEDKKSDQLEQASAPNVVRPIVSSLVKDITNPKLNAPPEATPGPSNEYPQQRPKNRESSEAAMTTTGTFSDVRSSTTSHKKERSSSSSNNQYGTPESYRQSDESMTPKAPRMEQSNPKETRLVDKIVQTPFELMCPGAEMDAKEVKRKPGTVQKVTTSAKVTMKDVVKMTQNSEHKEKRKTAPPQEYPGAIKKYEVKDEYLSAPLQESYFKTRSKLLLFCLKNNFS